MLRDIPGFVHVGDSAPDCVVLAGDGSEVRLATLWHERPLMLVFLRHFG